MKVLLDHDLPKALRLQFPGHLVLTARQMGWDALSNGRLIAAADVSEFDVLITADQKMYGEQSHIERKVSLLVVTASRLDYLLPYIPEIRAAIERAQANGYEMVKIPLPPKVQKRPDAV
jgi:hypothetical protein